MSVKNKSHVVTLMAVIAFALAITTAIAPAALAGRSQVYFSDVNGNPKTEWRMGEVLYITVISHDENRDSDEVELIDARSVCQTQTGVSVPCLEIWDPNSKDSETNLRSLVLVETGANTGIFRTQTGIAILPVEDDPGYQENGSLEVISGDTIVVRYQSPSDDTDVSLDLAKITSTRGIIRITNQAGQDVPLWQVGEQVFVTVEDPDADLDPLKPDVIKGVTLWNPRCVWDVVERQGQPRSDQAEPKPCDASIAPFAFDSALKEAFGSQYFADSLTLYETGPSTGVFRNVNGITLRDNLGPGREFADVRTALSLFVNHKDTIVAFYRAPTIVGVPAAPSIQPPFVETQTDACAFSLGLNCEQVRPKQVTPGAEFDVTVNITTQQDTAAVTYQGILPSGFSFVGVKDNPDGAIVGEAAGTIRAFWDGGIQGGDTLSLTFTLRAGAVPGDYTLKGIVTATEPKAAGVALSAIPVVATTSQSLKAQAVAENAALKVELTASPTQVAAGGSFTVTLTVTPKTAIGTGAARVNFDGLQATDKGSFFTVSGNELVALLLSPAANQPQTFTATLRCTVSGTITLNAKASAQNAPEITVTETVACGEGQAPQPQPGAGGYYRGLAGFNDPQDFALAQAKVGHANPATIKFVDVNGNELSEFALGTEFFIEVADNDQNVDSDHVETICVQIFNVNGGREGDTPGVFRALQDQLKDDPRACLEDHVRDLYMWKTGVKLVETGTNTGIFRNPNALKIVGICALPEAENYPFDTDPKATAQIQIHKNRWWAEPTVKTGTVLKDCYPGTPMVDEARQEFGDPWNPKEFKPDVPGVIAAFAGDVVYAVFQDQLVDPYDVIYATARVQDFQTFDGQQLSIQFVDENGTPIEPMGGVKVGQDVFIQLRDDNRNVNPAVVDKIEILVLDRATGDWENVLLEETGPNTGVFVNAAGLSLQPATSPDAVRVNNNRLEVFDRDTIEAHYQDNYNPKDYSVAWIRLVPQPEPGPGEQPGVQPTEAYFSDAQGNPVTEIAPGDTLYVAVKDYSQSGTLRDAITVKNTRTGQSVTVSASQVAENLFVSDPITTGAPGSGAMLEVEEGDTLEATYTDPADPTDTVTRSITVVVKVFSCTGAKNFPNPFSITTTFAAEGSAIAEIRVDVYDLSGRLIAQLQASGSQVSWDGRTLDGTSLGSGVYLYQVTCSGRAGETATMDVQKLVILR